MAGTIYSRFFWQDWSGDDELILCSMAAQGFWMRLLCVAAGAAPIGHVKVAGRKPTIQELHDITRCPADQIQPLIDELIRNQVCDVTREGILVSRRMVRDARKRESSVKGGKSRQRQRIDPTEESGGSSRTAAQPPLTRVQSPLANPIAQEAESKALEDRQNAGRAARLSKALRLDPADWHRHTRLIEQMVDFKQKGFDLDADVVPCIEQMAADGRIPGDVRSLHYFEKPVRAFVEARGIAAAAERLMAEQEAAKVDAMTPKHWENYVYWWLFDGVWPERLGAPPLQPGCRAPVDVRKVRETFQRLGERPYAKPDSTGRYEPIDWPAGQFARIGTSQLELEDMHRFLNGGVDVRTEWEKLEPRKVAR